MEKLLALDGVEIPKNCRECDRLGISDIVGLKCPCLDDMEMFTTVFMNDLKTVL